MNEIQVEVYELVPTSHRWTTAPYLAVAFGAIALGVIAALILH